MTPVTTSEPLFTSLKECISTRSCQIAVIGLGYVGLPLAKGFAAKGFRVAGIEENPQKVESLRRGVDYIEPALQDLPGLLEKFTPTTDFDVIKEANVVVICVPTPLTKNLEPDISYVHKVSLEIGTRINSGTLVILESTTYPGTTDEIVRSAIEAGGRVSEPGKDYFLAFSPERVDPGNPYYNTSNTTKVLGGTTPACAHLTALVYEGLLGSSELVKVASCTRAAEMEKLFENIFRSVNIALVNELSLICRAMGLDVWEIIELASSKPYGFMPFYPGPGIGGHCIPLDPFYLTWKAREYDLRTKFIELAGELNSSMPKHVVDLIAEALGDKGLRNAKVLLAGAAYKPNISDYRESPTLKVIKLLRKRGAEVRYHDHLVPQLRTLDGQTMNSVPLPQSKEYDVCVLLTVHEDSPIEALCECAHSVVDTRGITRGLPLNNNLTVLGVAPPAIPPSHVRQP